jgi:predicted  nucleic acid-binding Zn-ribbon protein
LLPGQFTALLGVTIDKLNRVFTSEQYVARVQMFRYVTDEEARAEKAKRDAEEQKKTAAKAAVNTPPAKQTAAASPAQPAQKAATPQNSTQP